MPQTLPDPRRPIQPGRLSWGSERHSTRLRGHCPRHRHRTIVRSTYRARSEPAASRARSTTGAPSPLSTPQHPTVPTCTPATTGTPLCWQGASVRWRWDLEEPTEQGFALQSWAGCRIWGLERPPSMLGFGRPCWWQWRWGVLRSLPRPVRLAGPPARGRWVVGLHEFGGRTSKTHKHTFCKPRA